MPLSKNTPYNTPGALFRSTTGLAGRAYPGTDKGGPPALCKPVHVHAFASFCIVSSSSPAHRITASLLAFPGPCRGRRRGQGFPSRITATAQQQPSQGLPGPPRASRRGPGSRPGDHRRGPRSPNSPPIAQPIKKPYISLKICKKQGFFPSFPFISAFLCLC